MNTEDIPLVAFTILSQMAVGAFVVLGVVHVLAGRNGTAGKVDKLSDPAMYAIWPVMVIALAVSLFHLGDPLHALNTVRGFAHSWLSREIVFGSLFTLLAFIFAICQWRRWLGEAGRQILAAVTAVIGLILVFCTSMIYLLPTVPGWDSWATPVSFYVATFLLGSLAIGAAFVTVTAAPRLAARHGGDTIALLHTSLHWISITTLVLLGIEFVVEPAYGLQLASHGGAAAQAAHLMLFGGGSVFILQLALVFAGAGLIGAYLYTRHTSDDGHPIPSPAGGDGATITVLGEKLTVWAATGAFALVLIAEVLARLLFYTGYARIGI